MNSKFNAVMEGISQALNEIAAMAQMGSDLEPFSDVLYVNHSEPYIIVSWLGANSYVVSFKNDTKVYCVEHPSSSRPSYSIDLSDDRSLTRIFQYSVVILRRKLGLALWPPKVIAALLLWNGILYEQ